MGRLRAPPRLRRAPCGQRDAGGLWVVASRDPRTEEGMSDGAELRCGLRPTRRGREPPREQVHRARAMSAEQRVRAGRDRSGRPRRRFRKRRRIAASAEHSREEQTPKPVSPHPGGQRPSPSTSEGEATMRLRTWSEMKPEAPSTARCQAAVSSRTEEPGRRPDRDTTHEADGPFARREWDAPFSADARVEIPSPRSGDASRDAEEPRAAAPLSSRPVFFLRLINPFLSRSLRGDP